MFHLITFSQMGDSIKFYVFIVCVCVCVCVNINVSLRPKLAVGLNNPVLQMLNKTVHLSYSTLASFGNGSVCLSLP